MLVLPGAAPNLLIRARPNGLITTSSGLRVVLVRMMFGSAVARCARAVAVVDAVRRAVDVKPPAHVARRIIRRGVPRLPPASPARRSPSLISATFTSCVAAAQPAVNRQDDVRRRSGRTGKLLPAGSSPSPGASFPASSHHWLPHSRRIPPALRVQPSVEREAARDVICNFNIVRRDQALVVYRDGEGDRRQSLPWRSAAAKFFLTKAKSNGLITTSSGSESSRP